VKEHRQWLRETLHYFFDGNEFSFIEKCIRNKAIDLLDSRALHHRWQPLLPEPRISEPSSSWCRPAPPAVASVVISSPESHRAQGRSTVRIISSLHFSEGRNSFATDRNVAFWQATESSVVAGLRSIQRKGAQMSRNQVCGNSPQEIWRLRGGPRVFRGRFGSARFMEFGTTAELSRYQKVEKVNGIALSQDRQLHRARGNSEV
jgi:hypothetical protein